MNTTVRRSVRLVALPIALVALVVACRPPTGTVESVDVSRYAGTWYEIASIKQFFSVGLVNTKAEYTLQPDGSIKVVNSGRYGSPTGTVSRIEGKARAIDASNSRLNVSFNGEPSTTGAGNYWIVDLDPAYQWAIVSDAQGMTAFILTRTPRVSDQLRAELLERARAKGLDVSRITVTQQF